MQNQSGEVGETSYPVISRLKSLYGASSLTELADHLDTPLPTVKGWSQRQSVPLSVLVTAAVDRKCSLDWLVGLVHDPGALRHVPRSKGLNQSVTREPVSKVFAVQESGTSSTSVLSLRTPDGPMEFHFVPHLNPMGDTQAVTRYPAPDSRVLGDIAFQAGWMARNLGRVGEGFAVVEMSGTSMEPTIYPGDTMVVDRTQRAVESGGLFALRLGTEVVVRRLQRMISGTIKVLCDNEAFSPEVVPPEAEIQLDIIGRVVWPRSR